MKYIGLWTEWRNKILHVMKCTLENSLALFHSIMTFSVLLHDFFEKKLLKFFWLVNKRLRWSRISASILARIKWHSVWLCICEQKIEPFFVVEKNHVNIYGHWPLQRPLYITYSAECKQFLKKILYLPSSSISSSKPCLKIVTNTYIP